MELDQPILKYVREGRGLRIAQTFLKNKVKDVTGNHLILLIKEFYSPTPLK